MFNVAIIGGSSTNDYEFFEKKCIQCLRNKAKTDHIMIYSIGDEYVEKFANRFNIDVKILPTYFKKYKSDALKLRNDELFSSINAVIAFDALKDAKVIAEMAQQRNLPVRLIKRNGKH